MRAVVVEGAVQRFYDLLGRPRIESIYHEYAHNLTVCEKCIHCRQIVVKNDDNIVK